MPEDDFRVNHHSYVVPGIVDKAVCMKQAERRRDQDGETTIVHDHPYESAAKPGREHGCSTHCMIIEPGYYTRQMGTYRVKMEDQDAEV